MELVTSRRLSLLVVLLAAVHSSGAINHFLRRMIPTDNSLRGDYDRINEQLIRSVRSEEPRANLLEVQSWTRALVGDDDEEPAEGSRRSAPRQRNLAAMVQLNLLLRLLDRPKCNLFDYEVLRTNELATGARLSVPLEQLGPLRRLDSVVRQVLVEHAEQCRFEYPKLFQWTKRDAPHGLLAEVRRMMNRVIETSRARIFATMFRPMEPVQILKEKALGVSLAGKEETRALLAYLRRRALEDPDSRYLGLLGDASRRNAWTVVEAKVEQLFEKYAVRQCEQLHRVFDHILRPAAYEEQVYPADHKYRPINEETGELMIFLQYHRLCSQLLESRKTVSRNLISAIWAEL